MTKEELVTYILNRDYKCPCCVQLQKLVAEHGLAAIANWKGMICASIEDMQIRAWEVETGKKFVAPPDMLDFLD